MDLRRKAERKSRTGGNSFRTTARIGSFPPAGAFRRLGALHGGDVHNRETALSGGEDPAHHLRALDSVRVACVEEAHRDAGIEYCLPYATPGLFSENMNAPAAPMPLCIRCGLSLNTTTPRPSRYKEREP